MNRTSRTPKPKAPPRPGAAKLNLAVDKEIGIHSARITKALVGQAIEGNPTCLHLLIRWAENAEFAQECISAHGSELTKWIAELEEETKETEEEEAKKTPTQAAEKDGTQPAT